MKEEHHPLQDSPTHTSTGTTLPPSAVDVHPSDPNILRRLDRLLTVLEKQALRDASQSDDEAVVAFRERVNKTTKLSIFGAFIATICISLLSLAQASFTSPSKLTEYTYVALYLALVVSLNATAISGMDAVMLENTRVDIRRVCYLHASFIFRTVPVMLSVA